MSVIIKLRAGLNACSARVDRDYFVCEVYGNMVEVNALERCPICEAPKDRFKEIL